MANKKLDRLKKLDYAGVSVGLASDIDHALELIRDAAEILEAVNRLGIGPQGMGGTVTALAVHVRSHPCHIASLPGAVNLQCHSARHKEAVL